MSSEESSEEGCAKCRNGQFAPNGRRLCDYGVSAIPVPSQLHPLGICGPERRLFSPVGQQRYAEHDE